MGQVLDSQDTELMDCHRNFVASLALLAYLN
jgi:hypothetical protein